MRRCVGVSVRSNSFRSKACLPAPALGSPPFAESLFEFIYSGCASLLVRRNFFRGGRDARQVETYMKSMASALFGVLATVGGVPIIRALPGGPTQMISEQLSKVHYAMHVDACSHSSLGDWCLDLRCASHALYRGVIDDCLQLLASPC